MEGGAAGEAAANALLAFAAVLLALRGCIVFVFLQTKTDQFSANMRSLRQKQRAANRKITALACIKKRYACVTSETSKMGDFWHKIADFTAFRSFSPLAIVTPLIPSIKLSE